MPKSTGLIAARNKLIVIYSFSSLLLTSILHTVFLTIHLNISYVTAIGFSVYIILFYILDKIRYLRWVDLLISNIFWLLLLSLTFFINWRIGYTYIIPTLGAIFLSFLTIYLGRNRKLLFKISVLAVNLIIISAYSILIVPKLEYGKHQLVTSNTSRHIIFEDSWLLKDSNGNDVSIANLTNKVVYVEFWYTRCPPCLAKLPTIKLLKQKFIGQNNVVFVSILTGNVDSFEVFKSWASKYQHTFDLFLYAPKKRMEIFIKKTSVNSSPYEAIFLNGALRSAHLGFTTAEAPYYLKEKEELIVKLLKEVK